MRSPRLQQQVDVRCLAGQEPTSSATSELQLHAEPSALGTARKYAEEAAASFGLGDDECFDFAVAVNEAVTNAVRHGAPDELGRISLSVLANDDRLTLSVRDYGTFVLPLREGTPTSDHGRGLSLMARLTDEVRVCIAPGSTTVYLSKARA
jgi:stage II sporulation protein AB (anti-sigma F factor)